MTTQKLNQTLKQLIISHDNNYGFNVKDVIKKDFKKFPTLSIVLPFYEDKKIINLTLKHLYNGIDKVKDLDNKWKFEIIIIDDGSKEAAKSSIDSKKFPELKIIRHQANRGRTAVRNKGLHIAANELCLFMDSDILIDTDLILNHLKVQKFARQQYKKIITVGFFEFLDMENPIVKQEKLLTKDIKLNDFRLDCIYQKSWFGCKEDKQYIGRQFKILQQTNMLRNWPKSGFLGPWLLTNMVLGGFFIVDTRQAKQVKGFSPSFTGYGFTETSLPTKLVSAFDNYIIPVPFKGGLHIEPKKSSLKHEREKKDSLFRKRHGYYFNNYLQLTLQKALAETN
ncbi:MAG: glycosyltransferase family 2 protein [bacterium]